MLGLAHGRVADLGVPLLQRFPGARVRLPVRNELQPLMDVRNRALQALHGHPTEWAAKRKENSGIAFHDRLSTVSASMVAWSSSANWPARSPSLIAYPCRILAVAVCTRRLP